MVDWRSAEELQKDAAAFDKLIHVLLGIYVWEWITSLEFEWQFISRKKKFVWPMIFYFLNRYCLLFSLTGIIIALDVTTEINCQALYTFNQFFGSAAIGLASINLSLRTIAVWSRKWYILYPIVVIILGHWSLLFHGVLLKAEWIQGQGCTFTQTNNTIMVAMFIYSMVFDFIITALTGIKLVSPSSNHSRLRQLIFRDGLIYFILAFLSNVIATVFMVLDLNAVMSLIANVPAATISTIVACRIVRRLSNFASDGPQVFPSLIQGSSTLAFRSFASGVRPKVSTKGAPTEGVHVQMETFQNPPSGKAESAEYDSAGQIKSDTPDSEAQIEFKLPPY